MRFLADLLFANSDHLSWLSRIQARTPKHRAPATPLRSVPDEALVLKSDRRYDGS
jgi:hypothetical protein